MQIIKAAEVSRVLRFPALIEAMRTCFAEPAGNPPRHVYSLDDTAEHSPAFAVLPAWNERVVGMKAFTYFPDNANTEFETVYAEVLLFSRQTGVPLALVDGTRLTLWRTAAMSALASDYLSRKNAHRLLLCGTGNLSSYMALAHAAVRPITEIAVSGRSAEKIDKTISEIAAARPDIKCSIATDLPSEAGKADIISCATASPKPLISGQWLRPGTHCDFVGNHEPDRRECDSQLVINSRLFVDSRENTLKEAGEILLPISEGAIDQSHVQAELAELCRGSVQGRIGEDDITCYKSVGMALADLAAAEHVFNLSAG